MRTQDPALRLIIAYKLIRAAASLLASGVLAALTASGRAHAIEAFAEQLRHHATSAWSIHLADALVGALAPRHLWLAVGALALDGAFTLLEGYALYRSWRWGPWLVVVATACALPFEAIAVAHHATAGRTLLLALNLAVALYLARGALRRK